MFCPYERAGDAGKTVLLETSGAHDISKVDRRVHRIMDLKTPGSGECERNRWSNIQHLTTRDEVKFVVGSREDYEWSREKMREHNLSRALPRRFIFAYFRPDRAAGNCGMDAGRQSASSLSTADAQIHLVADKARRMTEKAEPGL